MQTTSSRKLANGKTKVTIELDDDEVVIVIRKNRYYKLADPIDDVVTSRILLESKEVSWCSASQKWEE